MNDPINGNFGSNESPQQQAAELQRGKWILSKFPNGPFGPEIQINPPDNLGPREIVPGRETIGARYHLVSGSGIGHPADLLVYDLQENHVFASAIELNRPWLEELLRLANRPETP